MSNFSGSHVPPVTPEGRPSSRGGGSHFGNGKKKGGIVPMLLGAGILAATIALSVWVQGQMGSLAMAVTLILGGTIALTFSGLLGDVNKDGKVDVRDTMEYMSRAFENTLQGGIFSIVALLIGSVFAIGNLQAWLGMGTGTSLSIATITALWAGVSFLQGLHSWYFATEKNTNRTLVLLSRNKSLSPDLTDRTAPEADQILEKRRQSFSRFLKVLSFASWGAMAAEVVIVGQGSQLLQSANPLVMMAFLVSVAWAPLTIRTWGAFRDQILKPSERDAVRDLNDDDTGVQLKRS